MNWRKVFRSWLTTRHLPKRRAKRAGGSQTAETLEMRLVLTVAATTPVVPAWFASPPTPVTIHYDFRPANGVANQITSQEILAVVTPVLQDWTAASGGIIKFVRDTTSPLANIINIGVGDLSALGLSSAEGGPLAASTHALKTIGGKQTSVGTIWLDKLEPFYVPPIASSSLGGVSFTAVMAHEVGQILGLKPDPTMPGIMNPDTAVAQDVSGIPAAFQYHTFFTAGDADSNGVFKATLTPTPQLTIQDVVQLLNRASSATPTTNAIIAIVDRNGNILGVRQEAGVVQAITNKSILAFATDGAVSEARTAAFFANGTAPITSRTVEDLSQTTILQREVEANPNLAISPTVYGPGFVAPIGIGGNFPAGIEHTPDVDLFDIEASNRDSTLDSKMARFNIDPANIPSGQTINTPISYGTAASKAGYLVTQDGFNRGIGTLPGGIPIYLNGVVVGGIGVFFPGSDGYATHEQGFVHGVVKTVTQEMNTSQELEAEYIGYAALGGSKMALAAGVSGAVIKDINGFAPVPNTGLPFGFITLNGIALPLFGSTPGTKGLQDLLNQFGGHPGANSGTSQIFVEPMTIVGTLGSTGNTTYSKLLNASTVGTVTTYKQMTTAGPQNVGTVDTSLVIGQPYTTGYLVTPHTSSSSTLTVPEMTAIINAGIAAANRVRATLRLNTSTFRTGASGVRMTFAITDTQGNVLALYRMQDATVFSTDVAVAKARNVAYFDDPTQLQPQDQVFVNGQSGATIKPGTAFTSRTFRFLAEPLYPSGVNGSVPPQFSILNDARLAGINPETGQNIGAPAKASVFTSVMGHDIFVPGTNFHQKKNPNQNGIVFFPGSTPLYKSGKLVGGLGVSGDGVNQDDVVTFLAGQGYLANGITIQTADETFVRGVRLPYFKFDRNPFG